MVSVYDRSELSSIRKIIDRYNFYTNLGYSSHFTLERVAEDTEELVRDLAMEYCEDDEDGDELPYALLLKDDIKVEVYRIDGLTDEQKQEIVDIVQDAIHAYE